MLLFMAILLSTHKPFQDEMSHQYLAVVSQSFLGFPLCNPLPGLLQPPVLSYSVPITWYGMMMPLLLLLLCIPNIYEAPVFAKSLLNT